MKMNRSKYLPLVFVFCLLGLLSCNPESGKGTDANEEHTTGEKGGTTDVGGEDPNPKSQIDYSFIVMGVLLLCWGYGPG